METHQLVAAFVAAVSAYAVVRTARYMSANAIELGYAGGWAALVLLEVTVNLSALGVAIS